MAGSTPARKSGRRRVPNKKYSIDPFEGLEILSSGSEKDVEPSQQADNNSDDADFSAEQAAAAEEIEVNDEDDFVADDVSDRSRVATPIDEDDDADAMQGISRRSYAHLRWKRKTQDSSLHSRGMPEVKNSEAKENYLKTIFGTGDEDIVHIVRSKDQWSGEVSLPRRTTEDGLTGMRYFFSHTEDKREMEATVGWDWYYERGRDLFSNKQKLRPISGSEGDKYVHKPMKQSHSVLLGPYGKQRMFHLSQLETLELGETWKAATTYDVEGAKSEQKSFKGQRAGWILNVGTGVRCLDWAANHGGDTQYLAIATSEPRNYKTKELYKESPAFTPSPPSPSCIQIWSFSSSIQPGQVSSLDSTVKPQLRLVICTEWGPVKHLKWCPMPRRLRDEESRGKTSIGLLAGIWGDGNLRVLDVQMAQDSSGTTSYVKYNEASFAARPPKTLCTCLTWLSAIDIAVGCATGYVSIYDISGLHPSSPDPWFHMPLHQTYVLALTSAYPSFPHLLATSAVDGYLRLTDIRSPKMDSVLSNRSRIAPTTLAYSDPLFCIISSEENDQLRAYPLRRFFSSLTFAHCPALNLVLSVGRFHPTILAACADGSLVAVNPMRRVLARREHQYQQTIFQHEWNRSSGGISRITEGYKVETSNVTLSTKKASEGSFVTVYERETAVTQACWNPNLQCGGWMAAGMASGLVRVEDLAI